MISVREKKGYILLFIEHEKSLRIFIIIIIYIIVIVYTTISMKRRKKNSWDFLVRELVNYVYNNYSIRFNGFSCPLNL